MSKLDISNAPELLSFSNSIELLESRKWQLVERMNLCKDQLDIKKIEKQLKKIDALMKKTRRRDESLSKKEINIA